MTVAAPVYAGRILGTPDIPVSIRDDSGRLALDSSRAPHVTGSVSLSVEDAALLEDLDPRDNRRLVIDAGGRAFDLSIREANPDRGAATVGVRLASDEALLEDFAQLVDDNGPRAHEASLRAVVGYVLDKIGAMLEPGGGDADVTAFWEATNLVTNPGARSNANGYTAGSGTSAVARVTAPTILGLPTIRYTASGAGNAFLDTPVRGLRVTPGDVLTFSAYMASASNSRPARVLLRFLDQSGATILDSYSDAVMTSTDAMVPTRISRTRRVPPNAAAVSAYINTTVNNAGQNHYVSCLMLHHGAELLDWFDGSSSGGGYTYAWEDAANGSTSTRVPDVERDPESLMWRAGVSALEFLRPLVQAAGFRLVCNERREWTLRPAEYREVGSLTYRDGFNLIGASETLSRGDESWFDGAVFVYTWTDQNGIEQTRIDAWALTENPSKVIRREINAAYPGPGRAQYTVRRAQGRGRTVELTAQAKWTEAAEQPFTAILEGTPLQTGISSRVEFDLSTNEVTVTSRTTDTPAGVIDLLTGTINALTGTIANL